MRLSERVRDMVRNWLRIEPAMEHSVTIRETVGYAANCMRNRVWYRGDAGEIEQLFRALDGGSYLGGGAARFWAKVPSDGEVRKAHSGLPAILVDALAYLVKSDLNDMEFEADGTDAAGSGEVEADLQRNDSVRESSETGTQDEKLKRQGRRRKPLPRPFLRSYCKNIAKGGLYGVY